MLEPFLPPLSVPVTRVFDRKQPTSRNKYGKSNRKRPPLARRRQNGSWRLKRISTTRSQLSRGGGTGIGKETARELLAGGAKVVINGRREKILRDAAHELDPGGKRIAWVAGDAGQKPVAERLTAVAVERFGGVDILINNAGIFRPTPFLEHSEADVDAYLGVAVKGPFFASQAAIPEMLKRGCGSIVNVGSIWALIAVGATPSSAYSAGKAGMHTLTRNLAIEFAAQNIRVNAVAPA
jgi:NAD(P)-dependent dehydrogenase (short-subunit alcohol dehydrogenase family)